MSAFFFFSSRRRHTRFDCDWSSDVCSSDLAARLLPMERAVDHLPSITIDAAIERRLRMGQQQALESLVVPLQAVGPLRLSRSGERRVGEEGRSRWSPYH